MIPVIILGCMTTAMLITWIDSPIGDGILTTILGVGLYTVGVWEGQHV